MRLLLVTFALLALAQDDPVDTPEAEKPAILQELNWLKNDIKVVEQPWTQVQSYIDTALEGFDWYRPRLPPIKKDVKLEVGSPVWWYDSENQWWMTGTASAMSEKEADRADVLPTMVPPERKEEVGSVRKNVRVAAPFMENISWKAQKMRDIGEQQQYLGDMQVAKELFLASGILDNTNCHSYESMGLYYMREGNHNFTRAKNLLISSISKSQGWWKPVNTLGKLYHLHGMKADSLRMFLLAWEKNPLNVQVLDNLAFHYLQEKDYVESCFYYYVIDRIKSMNKLKIRGLRKRLEWCSSSNKSDL